MITKLSANLVLTNYSGLFKEILIDPRALYSPVLVEVDVDVFSEPAGVVIANSLGISKCLIQMIELEADCSIHCSPSRIGLVSRICCSIQECLPLLAARYWRISLVLSVLPAPDSPLMTIHWFCLNNRLNRKKS